MARPRKTSTLTGDNVYEFSWRSELPYANGLGKRGASLSDFWDADMVRAIQYAYKAARNAASKDSVPFNLSEDELLYLMRRSLGRCEITGIRFNGDNFSVSRRRPFVPSIDRIEPKEPYSLENCRLVAWIVNLAISDWGEDIFWVMVKAAGKRGRYSGQANESEELRINRAAKDELDRLAEG